MKISIQFISVLSTLILVFSLGYISIEIMGDYGFILFILIPILIGYLPPAIAARKQDVSRNQAFALSFLTLALACLVLLVFAFEGLICIAMALPILLLVTWGASYIAFVTQKERPLGSTGINSVLGLLALSMLSFDSMGFNKEPLPVRTSVLVQAPINEVWTHVVTFDSIAEPSDWIFKTGISYPTHATIEGYGIDAVRYCNFTTGSFVEPITTWDEPSLLQFDVANQPIPMNEVNPFGDVHPPHLDGYFKSHKGQFKLSEMTDGSTKLEGTTWYSVDIRPYIYWESWSEFIIHRIHYRVLKHIKYKAELQNEIQASSKYKTNHVQVDSAYVYLDFIQGGTTASVSYSLNQADSMGAQRKWLTEKELSKLNQLLTEVKEKKHFQQKFGDENLFIIGFKSGRKEKLLLAKGSNKIVNLSLDREYKFRDENIPMLNKFFERMKIHEP